MKLLFADFSSAGRDSRVAARSGVGRTHDRAAESSIGTTALRRLPDGRRRSAPARRVLLPVLDSVSSMAAARYIAREFMSGERMEVHLLHVRTVLSLDAECWICDRDRAALHHESAQKLLQPVRDLLDALHIRYVVHVEIGDRAPVIVAMAQRLGVDRIVLGAARDNSLLRLTEDPVIEKVIDFAPVPVDVVASRSVSRLEQIAIPAGLGAALGLLCIRLVD